MINADVTKRDEGFSTVERTVGMFGRLDIFVNNAGVMPLGQALDAPIEE